MINELNSLTLNLNEDDYKKLMVVSRHRGLSVTKLLDSLVKNGIENFEQKHGEIAMDGFKQE